MDIADPQIAPNNYTPNNYRDPYSISKLSAKYQFCAIHTADNTDGKVTGEVEKNSRPEEIDHDTVTRLVCTRLQSLFCFNAWLALRLTPTVRWVVSKLIVVMVHEQSRLAHTKIVNIIK